MGDSLCHHAVVGTLLIHQGRIATAMRVKPPINRAPSAGHVEPADGLDWSRLIVHAGDDPVFRAAAGREAAEETGYTVDSEDLVHLLTWSALDSCAKTAFDGGPGGTHLWRVYGYVVPTISRPDLRDEPGGMTGWDWRSPSALLADPELEPIWHDMLSAIMKDPDNHHWFA